MRVGIAGPGNQAGKIAKAMQKAESALRCTVYLHREGAAPSKDLRGPAFEPTSRLDDLASCQAVVIASPNEAHASQVRALLAAGYDGYIFLEKPPAQDERDIDWLESLSEGTRRKIFVNFNYRRSVYFRGLVRDAERFGLGALLSVNVSTSHGLGLNPSYGGSWRASREHHAGGVFETVAIHFLDMLVLLRGAPERADLMASVHSPYGDAPDNCLLSCLFPGGVTLSVTASYTAPFMSSFTALYENGVVTYGDEKTVRAPRETFDESGLFSQPPVVHREPVQRKTIARDSLAESVEGFLRAVRSGEGFALEEYAAAMETSRVAARLVARTRRDFGS